MFMAALQIDINIFALVSVSGRNDPVRNLANHKNRSSLNLIAFPDGTHALIQVDKFEICEINSDCAFSFRFKCIRKAINLICCAKSSPPMENGKRKGASRHTSAIQIRSTINRFRRK